VEHYLLESHLATIRALLCPLSRTPTEMPRTCEVEVVWELNIVIFCYIDLLFGSRTINTMSCVATCRDIGFC